MGKVKVIRKSHTVGFYKIPTYEGKTIERRINIMTETNEPINDAAPLIYTEKAKGVQPQYNIRTDKWVIAQKAMDAVNREKIAKGMAAPKVEEEPAKGGDGDDAST